MWRNLSYAIFLLSCFTYAELSDTKNNEWDFLIFTQHWPATICRIWMEKPTHSCIMPHEQNSWTIHGIWPNKNHSMGPFFCNKTWSFDPDQVKPIETDLEESWGNIEKEQSLYSLWAHEWTKHGTCAASIEPLNCELKYFTKGLEWLKKYTMKNILNNAGITPSDMKEYKVIDFHNAVKAKLGFKPMVECHKVDGKQFLFEIRICFSKSLELIDCEDTHMTNTDIITNCKPTEGIIYPVTEKPPKRYLIQLHRLLSWLRWFTV